MKLTASRRRYLYGVSVAALPLLIAAGVLTDNLVPSVVALLGAALVPDLARRNVTEDGPDAS